MHRKVLATDGCFEMVEHLEEELSEFTIAVEDGDLVGQADALVDIVYVALDAAIRLGLPWQELWDDVQRVNMTKVRGITHRGHALDVKKPDGWEGPKTAEILALAGYTP